MMESGFWDSVGSGGMVYGLPDGTLPGRDIEPDGAPEEGGAEGGPLPPGSMPPIMLGEVRLSGGLPPCGGTPGLCMGGFGEEAHPGEGF